MLINWRFTQKGGWDPERIGLELLGKNQFDRNQAAIAWVRDQVNPISSSFGVAPRADLRSKKISNNTLSGLMSTAIDLENKLVGACEAIHLIAGIKH